MPNRTFRVSTPPNWAAPTQPFITANASYTMPAPGSTIDVANKNDAAAMGAAGFIVEGLVGTTGQRPLPSDTDWPFGDIPGKRTAGRAVRNAYPGSPNGSDAAFRYFDTSLAAWIVYDASIGLWVNQATGAVGV